MKTTLALCLALFALSSAEAQNSRAQHAGGSQGGGNVHRSSPGAYSGNGQGRMYSHAGHGGHSRHSGHSHSHHGHSYGHGGIGYYGGGFGYGYPRYGYRSY